MITDLPQNITDLELVLADLLAQYQVFKNAKATYATLSDVIADNVIIPNLLEGDTVYVFDHGGFPLEIAPDLDGSGDITSGARFLNVTAKVLSPHFFGDVEGNTAEQTRVLDACLNSTATFIELRGTALTYDGVFAPGAKVFRSGSVTDNAQTFNYFSLLPTDILTSAEHDAEEPTAPTLARAPNLSLVNQLIADRAKGTRFVSNTVDTSHVYGPASDLEIVELRTGIQLDVQSHVRLNLSISFERFADAMIYIKRNDVEIFSPEPTGTGSRVLGTFPINYDNQDQTTMTHIAATLIDEELPVGNHFYSFWVRGSNSSFYLNRTVTDADAATSERGVSQISLEQLPLFSSAETGV